MITSTLARSLAQTVRHLHRAMLDIFAAEGAQGIWHQRFAASQQQPGLPAPTLDEFVTTCAQTIIYGVFAEWVGDQVLPSGPDQGATPTPVRPLRGGCFPTGIPREHFSPAMAGVVEACTRLLATQDIERVLRHDRPGSPLPWNHAPGWTARCEDLLMYGYEPFLAACNASLRARRGVFSTPAPVVSYLVRSVDALLQQGFERPMGLADEQVFVLDPATGTAPFLCAVVRQVYATLTSRGQGEPWRTYAAEKLLPRLVGLELMLTPALIGRFALHLLLSQSGGWFASTEPIRIYQADALTTTPGEWWEHLSPGVGASSSGGPLLVVLGNPPYANFGRLNRSDRVRALLSEYKVGLNEKKLNLDDDFIKFIRAGQWWIDQHGAGILALVTSNTYLDGITHRRMRQSLLETFTDGYILNLHGHRRKHEHTPTGTRDENVFDIQQGVAIGVWVKQPGHRGPARVRYAEQWGTRDEKYAYLSEASVATTAWTDVRPTPGSFFLVPRDFGATEQYEAWWSVRDIFPVQQNSIKTDRDDLFVDRDRRVLEQRIRTFYSEAGVQSPFRERYRVENTSSYALLPRRLKTSFHPAHLRPCLYRPFDVRWLYYAPGLTSRPAWEVMRHMLAGENLALVGMRQYDYHVSDYCYVLATEWIIESRVFLSNRGAASLFPLYLYACADGGDSRGDGDDGAGEASEEDGRGRQRQRQPNLAEGFLAEVEQRTGLRCLLDGAGDLRATAGPEDIFHYLYAVLHSPTYRRTYAALLKIDFPRVWLTDDAHQFAALARQGAALVDYHLLRLPGRGGVGGGGGVADLACPAPEGVTFRVHGNAPIGRVRYCAGPGQPVGRVGIGPDHAVEGIAPDVWDRQVGGYRPLEKWLRDRQGCPLREEDIRHYLRMITALGATNRLMGEIDIIIKEGLWNLVP
ncbi:MAG: hypothetical protein HC884_10135 [Chloroflexaceae bacterium]|nr:hypothetical protein [Chloroflexaceae bacterium]